MNGKVDNAMKVIRKGYTDIHQTIIEHIFKSETLYSYEIKSQRWYVCQFNKGHYIHYKFTYTAKTVSVRIKISSSSKAIEQS